VRIIRELGEWFNITRGTQQGDNFSPKTFIGHLERVMDKNKERGKGISINGVKIDNLCFADNIDLSEESPQELQRALQLLSNEGRKTGLVIKREKTKTVVFGTPVIKKKLKVDGQDVENVTEFVYLGSLMTYNGSCSKDVRLRITKGKAVVNAMGTIWKSKNISDELKLKVLRTCVFSVALHACETWTLKKINEKNLRV